MFTFVIIITSMIPVYPSAAVLAQNGPAGIWTGAIDLPGMSLEIRVIFRETEDGYTASIDIPPQSAFGLPLREVSAAGDSVYFELAAGPGLAVFRGLRSNDVINGSFTQAGIRAPFQLNRTGDVHDDQPDSDVVDMPPPVSKAWLEQEVDVPSGDITLGCTITKPDDDPAHPAIILITGSGAQDRDETIFGFKPFLILAEHLTSQGYTVLRCDDRGVGASGGTLATVTSHDLATDVKVMMDFLIEQGLAKKGRIGLMGHSEGGIIAAEVAARRPETQFVIMLAGPALPGHEIIRAQSRLIMQAMDIPEEAINRQDVLLSGIFRAIESDSGWDEVESDIRYHIAAQLDAMTDDQKNMIADRDAYLSTMVQQQLAIINSPWYRYFIRHDPAKNLRQLRMPVLALFGDLDLQVPAEMNATAMRSALGEAGNTDYTILTIPGANHLFQKAETGSPTEYGVLEKRFIDGFLDTISDWLMR